MATGDATDMLMRVKRVLPAGWFPDVSPNLDAALSGAAWSLSNNYALLQFFYKQDRIATASGEFLDIACLDYLGTTLWREDGESDTSFRGRIRREILRPKATRAALIQQVTDITGAAPLRLIELRRPADTGAWGSGSGAWQGLAWNTCGAWGSRNLRHQFFVSVAQPTGTDAATNAQIYDAVARVIPAGTVAWVAIIPVTPRYDTEFYYDTAAAYQ